MVKCPYCDKEYKTEKGLEKHLQKCKIKQRLDYYNSHSLIRYNFVWFYKFYLPFQSKKVKDKDIPLMHCKSKYFDRLLKLTNFEEVVELYSPEDYFNYLVMNKININEWCDEQNLLNFLYEWSFNEPLEHAIYRSEKWLNEHNLTLETISGSDLFDCLKYGKLSYKYIQENGFDYANKLDIYCDIDELRFLKYFLRG